VEAKIGTRRAFSRAILSGVSLVASLWVGVPSGLTQAPASDADDERERSFVEVLRREDPGSADHYVALRDARRQAIAALQKAQAQYSSGAGPELRPLVIRQLRDAQLQYAKSSLAFLDFLDARDRRTLARYQDEIGRITKVLEDNARVRAELERQLRHE